MMDNTPNTPVAEPNGNSMTHQPPMDFSEPEALAAPAQTREEDSPGFVLGYN